ncbi:MAG: integrase core domain-containing protein [Verrucomicrobiota bacterium]
MTAFDGGLCTRLGASTARSSWPRTSKSSCACGKPATCSPVPIIPNPTIQRKLERFHRTLKEQVIGPKTLLTLADARRVVQEFVNHHNLVRLHSALGYVTPNDWLEGRQGGWGAESSKSCPLITVSETRETDGKECVSILSQPAFHANKVQGRPARFLSGISLTSSSS